MMKFFFKLVSCCIGLAITLTPMTTNLVDKLDNRSVKISEAKVKELRTEMLHFREERNLKIALLDKELKTKISGLETQMKEANELLRVLVRRSNKEYVFKQELEHRFNESI